MLALRIVVAAVAVAEIVAVLLSVLRTVVLPRAVPARLARVSFIAVQASLLLRLRLRGRRDYAVRDRVLSLQAPIGVFAQMLCWTLLVFVGFAALFWAAGPPGVSQVPIARAFELAGSSMATLGIDDPRGLLGHLVAFAAAGVGLTLLALVITFLPSLYGAFSRREAAVAKLAVRVGHPPTGHELLRRSWMLGRFDQLEEVWNGWEDWFIDVGESHTTFPQLAFFRSPRPENHWALAAEAILDGAALLVTACDVERQSRSELCLEAGIRSLTHIADFVGVPRRPDSDEPTSALTRDRYDAALDELAQVGIPLHGDRDATWDRFRATRVRYEALLTVLGRMTDAPRSDWSSWTDATPRHRPPLLRVNRLST